MRRIRVDYFRRTECTLKRYLPNVFGTIFIAFGFLLNERIVASIISPDGVIEDVSLKIRIIGFELFLFLTGVIIIKSHRRHVFHIKQYALIGCGLCCIGSGILLNEWIIARIFHRYGMAVNFATWLAEFFLILFGALIIHYRHAAFSYQVSKASSIGLLCVSLILSLFGVEIMLRFMGYQPWRAEERFPAPIVEPGGTFYQTHPTLGYRHLPGTFRVIGKTKSFHVTHLPNTLRITHPLDTYHRNESKKEIWIFGCSFTHGWGLDDHETYPWLLQKMMPQYEIVNFGVGGYGTLQSFIQFQEALEIRKKPKAIILAYASFHDERNTLPRTWRKKIVTSNALGSLMQPYARINKNNTLSYAMATVTYPEFPFMRHSAFVHLLEQSYNRIENRLLHSHDVSKALIKKFFELAQKDKIPFILAGIYPDALTVEMLEFCQQEGIMTVDISVDMSREEYVIPNDGHPSAVATRKYAQTLERFLTETLNNHEE